MIVGSNINTLLQQVMAMRTPELLEVIPEVEKLNFEARVAMVRRGHDNLSTIIKHWDKFAEILAAQRDLTKSEIKGQAKSLKNVRSKLEMALRLADPKIIPGPFRSKAETAFNVVTAWFLLNQNYMADIYSGPHLSRQDIAGLDLSGGRSSEMPESLPSPIKIDEEFFDGPPIANLGAEGLPNGPVDMLDATGRSAVM